MNECVLCKSVFSDREFERAGCACPTCGNDPESGATFYTPRLTVVSQPNQPTRLGPRRRRGADLPAMFAG